MEEFMLEAQATEADDAMTEDDIQGIVSGALDDAVDFIDNIVSPIRAQATEYYRGDLFGDEEDGRSQVVSMDVRDTVQAIMPSLLRIFTGTERAVEFTPQGPEDVDNAEQATDYANFIMYRDNPGFLVLHSAFKDALIRKAGIVKVYWDEETKVETFDMTGLDETALAVLASEQSAQIELLASYADDAAGVQVDPATGMQMPAPMMHDVRVRYERKDGRVKIEAIPPEEFLIDRRAKSLHEADFVAHRRSITVSDLVAMGYNEEDIDDLASGNDELDSNVERYTRNPALAYDISTRFDDAMKKVMYTECYLHVDFDGDGIAELRKVCVAGTGKKILSNEACAVIPFAVFCPDPEPHDFFGMSIADVTMDVQRIKSVLMRNTLDSLALAIHPRMTVVDGQANIDDVMNTEVGAIIRQTVQGAVQPLTVPFTGGQSFPMLDYMDQVKEARTGITRASAGLDADAMRNSTATAVNATVQASQQQIEMIARVFAEVGMKQLFKLVLHYITTHQDQPRMVRLRNEYVQIDPRVWNSSTMDVSINVALGRGTDAQRMAMLTQIGQMQKEALQTMGADNPLTDVTKLANTLSAMTELSGFKDPSRFWNDPAAYQPPPQPDPGPDINEMLIQVQIQQIKADIDKKTAELALQREKMQLEDDFKRDQLEADIRMKAAELEAQYGKAVDVERIKADLAKQRDMYQAHAAVAHEVARG